MKNRQAAIPFIFITVMLDMVALGLIAPVLPNLILSFVNNDMTRTAIWNGIFLTVFAAMQFFFSPVIGVLSDRFGRRPVLLLSSLGLGLDYVVMALAPTLSWLFVGRLISGITSSTVPTAFAYIADVTPKEKRAGAFGLIGAAFGIGFTLGPVIGGIVGNSNPRMAFWAAAAFSLGNWLYGFLFVPESLDPKHRKAFTWGRANPVGSLVLLRSHPDLWKLATIQFLAYVSHETFAIWALFAITVFHWKPRSIGESLFVVGVCTAVISGGLTGRIVKWLGEKRTVYIGQLFGGLGMIIAGLARTGAMYIASIPVISMWNISFPAAQGIMTHHVSEREQGELQGAISSLRSIAFVIGPFLFSGIFAWSIDPSHAIKVPGAGYFLAAALLFTAAIMATRIQQPRFAAPSATEISDVVPPEGVTSGTVAPMMDSPEKI
ncbi:MAG TPA: TCR/Tet family MFS transporter [Candidatus Udaeobacter sp.]|jgi:DHA1 family tetracycline resistance protein-like MFS transporter|nr:TCR/Tet family MFS transporter [Candidatus Udaeobacter sp.]